MKPKKILYYFPLYASIICVIRVLLPLVTGLNARDVNSFSSLFLDSMFMQINFNFLHLFDLFDYYVYERMVYIHFVNLTFYIFTLVGAIIFLTSKGKESRIVRFSLSLYIFWGIVVTILSTIIVFRHQTGYFSHFSTSTFIIQTIFNLFWGSLSWLSLKEISKNRVLNCKKSANESLSANILKETPLIQRFMHNLIDLYLSVLICLHIFIAMGLDFMSRLEHLLGERPVIFLIAAVSRIIWYLFFEIFFGATPAKFLTESKVVMADGSKVTPKAVILRTISRLVPFEAFSFLFGSKGWHDRWTKTMVVKEEPTGVRASRYWLIVPLILLIALVEYGSVLGYEKYQSSKFQKTSFQEEIEVIENELSHLSPNQVYYFLEIKCDDWYEGTYHYAKVNKVEGNNVTFSVFKTETSLYSEREIEKSWLENSDPLKTIVLPVDSLRKAYSNDFKTFKKRKEKGINLLDDGNRYYIKKIYRIFEPVLHDRGSGSWHGDGISINLSSTGHSADLIAIENIVGDLKWQNKLPEKVRFRSLGDVTVSLNASNFNPNEFYQFKTVLKDSLGNVFHFKTDIKKNHRKMIRIY
jgi:uncharacterized RDD family membrane protein YckC